MQVVGVIGVPIYNEQESLSLRQHFAYLAGLKAQGFRLPPTSIELKGRVINYIIVQSFSVELDHTYAEVRVLSRIVSLSVWASQMLQKCSETQSDAMLAVPEKPGYKRNL